MSYYKNIINILQITLRSDIGGGQKHLYDLVTSLNKYYPKRINIFISSPKDPPFYDEFKKIAIEHFDIPHRKFSLVVLIKMLHFCYKNKINIIHSHGKGAGIYSRLLGILGFNIIHTFHGIHIDSKLRKYFFIFYEYVFSYFTKYYINVSKSEYDLAIKNLYISSYKLQLITLGIDIDKIKIKQDQTNEIRVKYNFKKNDVVIGCLSRLEYMKGFDLLINTILETKLSNRYKFVIAGDGQYRKILERMVKQNNLERQIYFYGKTNKPIKFLNELDVFCSFSRGEALGISVLEALSLGIPCLLSNVKGHFDIMQNHPEYLFNNSFEFKNKLINCNLNRDSKYKNIVKKNYDIKVMVDKIFQIYEDLK